MKNLIWTTNWKRAIPLLFLFTLPFVSLGQETNREIDSSVVIGVRRPKIDRPILGELDLTSEQARVMPSLMGENDLMKHLQRFPGVQSVQEGRSGMVVRGGEYDQNLIMLDGMTLFNSEHLGGFVSSVNPDIVENVRFYRSFFPSEYGGRLSSIVDLKVRDGDLFQYHGSFTAGLLSSRFTFEGPVIKGKTSFLIGGRISYYDKILGKEMMKRGDEENMVQNYMSLDYYDVNAKFVHHFSQSDILRLSLYKSSDHYDLVPEPYNYDRTILLENRYPGARFRRKTNSASGEWRNWGNTALQMKYDHFFRQECRLSASLNYVQYNLSKRVVQSESNASWAVRDRNTEQDSFTFDLDSLDINNNSKIHDISIRAGYYAKYGENHSLTAGVFVSDSKLLSYEHLYRETVEGWSILPQKNEGEIDQELIDSTIAGPRHYGTISIYAGDEWSISRRLSANLGFRATTYLVKDKKYFVPEPRFAVSVFLVDSTSLKASWARMSQPVHLLTDNNLVSISDKWMLITESISPMTADLFSVGIYKNFRRGWDLSLEAYYKKMSNLLEYREGASVLLTDWDQSVVQGTGRAYGTEFMIQKTKGKTTGWISYTWSKSLRLFDRQGDELNNGEEFFASSDVRNNLNMTMSQKIGRHLTLSASFTYHTGHRGTLADRAFFGTRIDETYFLRTGELYHYYHVPYPSSLFYREQYMNQYLLPGIEPGQTTLQATGMHRFLAPTSLNNYILPSIHRLDVSANYQFQTGKISHMLNLSVHNVYNHMNISYVYDSFDSQNRHVLKGICVFPIFPSLSYSIKF